MHLLEKSRAFSMKAGIICSGYVRLDNQASLIKICPDVFCIDIELSKIEKLKQDIMLILVSGLLDLAKDKFAKVYLKYSIYFKFFKYTQISVKE